MTPILNIMRFRATRIVLLAFEAMWLNVIVPGHSRGAVGLPGETCPHCATVAGTNTSGSPAHCNPGAKSSPRDSHPAKDPAAHCSICHFAARTTPPPVITFVPPKLELLAIRPTVVTSVLISLPVALPYFGRAPPAF